MTRPVIIISFACMANAICGFMLLSALDLGRHYIANNGLVVPGILEGLIEYRRMIPIPQLLFVLALGYYGLMKKSDEMLQYILIFNLFYLVTMVGSVATALFCGLMPFPVRVSFPKR